MSEIEVGDTVVFRQVAPDGYASDHIHPILIEDHTAYQVHRGDVRKILHRTDSDQRYAVAKVKWDDGEIIDTPTDQLQKPENAEWYDG